MDNISRHSSESDNFDTRIDMQTIPISQMGQKCRLQLCTYLNAEKLLLSETGYLRDWRGLFDLAGIPRPYSQTLASCDNPTKELLILWAEEGHNANFHMLQTFLIEIDRIDCLDDCKELFEADAQAYYKKKKEFGTDGDLSQDIDMICTMDDRRDMELGLPLQQYDALLIYADSEEEDLNFARILMKEMTEIRDLKICSSDMILGGNQFEHDAKRTLLTKRCNRLIVIISASESYSMSKQDQFLSNLAQSIGIENQTRKLIPVTYKNCQIPELFQHMTILNYGRALNMYNFWDRLYESVKVSRLPSAQVADASKTASTQSLNQSESKINSTLNLQNIELLDSNQFEELSISETSKIYPPVLPRRLSNPKLDYNASQQSLDRCSMSDSEQKKSSKFKPLKKVFRNILSSKDKKDKKKQTASAVAV